MPISKQGDHIGATTPSERRPHGIYITEASADVGDVAAIQFEQSIMLLDENGGDVDREGLELVLAFIGSLFSRLLQ